MKYKPKPYMRTDKDILSHILDIVENLDGAGLVMTDLDDVQAELDNMREFICYPLRGGLYDNDDDELE